MCIRDRPEGEVLDSASPSLRRLRSQIGILRNRIESSMRAVSYTHLGREDGHAPALAAALVGTLPPIVWEAGTAYVDLGMALGMCCLLYTSRCV